MRAISSRLKTLAIPPRPALVYECSRLETVHFKMSSMPLYTFLLTSYKHSRATKLCNVSHTHALAHLLKVGN